MPDQSSSRQGLGSHLAVITLACCLSGCTGTGDGPEHFIVRDSAGVTIVESDGPSWVDGEGWSLSNDPIVTIGTDDGPEEYSLFQVAAAIRLPDGRMMIANGGTDELRYYDSTGTFLYSVGRDGFGPGEFKRMWGVWLVEDSIVVNDWGQDRVSVFSASGEYGRTLMLHREPGSAQTIGIGVFSDGTILGQQMVFDRDNRSDDGFQFSRTNVVCGRFSRDGDLLDSLGVFLWFEGVSETLNTRTDPTTGTAYASSVVSDAPFGRRASTIASGNFLYHGSSDAYEIQVFTTEGTLERIIRRPIPNGPVTEADIEAFKEDFLDGEPQFTAWLRRRVNDLEFPDTKPAYGRVKVDALGHLWVEEYTWPHKNAPGDWTVFDSDGRMLGVVEVPGNGSIFEIGEDYLVGSWRTDVDVEQVRMYRLYRH